MSDIADMFRRSPFDPIRVHMDKVMECVGHTKPMFERVRANDPEGLQNLARVVFKAEHQADLVKDKIRQTIPKSFFLPVYRGDLLGYLAVQDSMADTVEDLAVMLTLKRLHLPDQIADQFSEYLEKILWTCEKANDVSKALGELAEAGFTADHIDRVLEMVATTEKAEWEADRKQYEVSRALFSLEGQIGPMDIFLWFRVFGLLGELANHAEKVADRVRRMLAR